MKRLLLLLPLLSLIACRRPGFPVYPADYREYAYISNGGSNTVSVLDMVNLRQDRVLRVGTKPTGLAVNPVRNEVYVVNSGSNSVSVIEAETNRVAATIPVHGKPYFISVDHGGRRAYVANSASNNVSVLDLEKRRVIATAAAGEGSGEAVISPDDNALVVSNRVANSVSVLDGHTLKLRAAFPSCPQATDVVVTLDAQKAFIACSGGHQVMVLGLDRAATPTLPAAPDRLLAMLDVGQTPVHLALKPDGGEIFVSNFDSDTISEILTGTNEVGGAYLVGAHPAGGVVSADNAYLWISNFNADTVGVYSIDDGKLINTVHVGSGPDALAFSNSGFVLLVANAGSGDISLVRTASRKPGGASVIGSLFTMLPSGKQPNAIVVKSFRVK
jgi:YVTN family beta-propeller protein